MSVLQAQCPACGGPVEFKSGQSVVVICTYCHSAVARTDRELKDLGKVAEILETGSPLDVGLRGTWRGVPFEMAGSVGSQKPRAASISPSNIRQLKESLSLRLINSNWASPYRDYLSRRS